MKFNSDFTLLCRKLLSVRLDHNNLTSLSLSLFSSQSRLRFVDVSSNRLETLPETLFQRTSLEIFLAADNRLSEIPIKALNPVQSTLRHLDLAGNRISTISDSQLNQIQLLVRLDLSDNQVQNSPNAYRQTNSK